MAGVHRPRSMVGSLEVSPQKLQDSSGILRFTA
jgi:hypothetical protein